jgi:tetratricopeptide (TPR) repeat protein
MSEEFQRVRALGEALADRGRHREALVRFGEALAIDPNNGYVWSLIAYSRQELEDWPGMLEAAERRLALEPDYGEGHRYRAVALHRLRRYEEALVSAREAVRCDPDDAEAWRRLALQLDAMGEPEQARDAIARACRLDPGYVEGWITFGNLTSELGDYPEAERLLRHALTLDSAHLGALHQLAFLAGCRHEFDEAIAISKQILSIDPSRRSTLTNLADDLALAERDDEAFDLLRTCIGAYPHQPAFRQDLVQRLVSAGRLSEAVAAARAAVADLPQEAMSWWCLGKALDSDNPQRLAAALRAAELAPRSYEMWLLLGDVYREAGDIGAAARAYASAAETEPGDRWVMESVAYKLRTRLVRAAEALAYADRAVDLAPMLAHTHVERAAALEALDRHTEALDALRLATALSSATKYTWLELVQLASVTGHHDEAHAALRRAASYDDDHVGHEGTAMVAFAAGDLEGARTAAVQGIESDATCCCVRAIAALSGQPDVDGDTILAAPTERPIEDGRCYDLTCGWRAQLEQRHAAR